MEAVVEWEFLGRTIDNAEMQTPLLRVGESHLKGLL